MPIEEPYVPPGSATPATTDRSRGRTGPGEIEQPTYPVERSTASGTPMYRYRRTDGSVSMWFRSPEEARAAADAETAPREHGTSGSENYRPPGTPPPAADPYSQPGAEETTNSINEHYDTIDDAMADLASRTAIETPGASTIKTPTGPRAQRIRQPLRTPTAATVATPGAPLPRAVIGAVGDVGTGAIKAPTVTLARPETIDPYLAQRSAAGARQYGLADYLEGIVKGDMESPEALKVKREIAEQEAAQMSLAASAGPAGRAAALRGAMQNTGRIQAAGAAEIASRNEAYRAGARQQLMTLLDQVRSGDISEEQFNAQAINAARQLDAQLGTQTNIAEGQIKGQLGAAQISAGATLGAAGINARTQAAIRQAELDQDARFKVFDAEQRRNELNAQYEQAVRMWGADSAEARALAEAKYANDAELARYSQESETARTQGSLEQQAAQFAADLKLRARTQEDNQLLALLGQNSQLLELLQTGQLTREKMSADQLMQVQALANAWDIANLNSQTQIKLGKMQEPGFWDRFTAIAGPLLGLAGTIVGG
jgi:hypothetical protein